MLGTQADPDTPDRPDAQYLLLAGVGHLFLGCLHLSTNDFTTGTLRHINPLFGISVFAGMTSAAVLTGTTIIHTSLDDALTFFKAGFGG